ncbi:5900_t:CDS:2 [Funneliformis caledonium]|uniref:5900_t:CDS:1 n=1 Tax=Funneliformis caledonium TaxID=1117310 RepID=A0A9N8VI59_9GLOM|nr:5900_t:CDS:2 [Funneliformis caledonium]
MGILMSSPPHEDVDIPKYLIKANGKEKVNRWKIPVGLTDKETKALESFKKIAYRYDENCCCGFGLDPILGLVPVIGDFLGVWLSLMLIKSAKRTAEDSQFQNRDLLEMLSKMTWNIAKDVGVGFIPIIGDFFDFFVKANTVNAELFQYYLIKHSKNRSMVVDHHMVEVISHTS